MNIHEHQAKEILKSYSAPVSNGVVAFSLEEIKKKISLLKTNKFVVKAQIHAGGRGKAGGIKLVVGLEKLYAEFNGMLGKKLVTAQTGLNGKTVKRIYVEEASDIAKEFYLSCLIDRGSSKIAFISSTAGGMDIEKISKENPEKINTTKVDLKTKLDESEINKIISVFNLNDKQKREASNLINAMYKILKEKDATLIEINPLIITKNEKLLCLDAKMNFDDNAIYRRPEILKLRDLAEENLEEVKASKYDLAYIKLNGSIGCMVNGAGLAMATMDIIKLYGKEPANFLDVGGGATKEKVIAAFKLILSDKNVKGILINIFGGIMRCDILAQGVVDAAKETNLKVPLVVRLAGTNFEQGQEILNQSGIKIISAFDLNDAAKKIAEVIK